MKIYRKRIFFLNLLIIGVLVNFNSCEKKAESLFFINSPEGQENDILFMAESTNVEKIEFKKVLKYLTTEEILTSEKYEYKDFGKIYQNEKFKIHVILRIGWNARDYTFFLRTFTNKFILIDNFELAAWLDAKEKYCFGKIDSNLKITKTCLNENIEITKLVDNEGYFK